MRPVYSRILLRDNLMKNSFRIKQAIIVEKKSSVFGYAHQISTPLNLDHHSICKLKSKEDAIQRPSRDESQTMRLIASIYTIHQYGPGSGKLGQRSPPLQTSAPRTLIRLPSAHPRRKSHQSRLPLSRLVCALQSPARIP